MKKNSYSDHGFFCVFIYEGIDVGWIRMTVLNWDRMYVFIIILNSCVKHIYASAEALNVWYDI